MNQTVNPFRWGGAHGYYTDVETGRVNVRARTYEPAVARWTSKDPLGPTLAQLNPYCYANNGPLTFNDPSGLQPVVCTKKDCTECIDDGLKNDPVLKQIVNLLKQKEALSGLPAGYIRGCKPTFHCCSKDDQDEICRKCADPFGLQRGGLIKGTTDIYFCYGVFVNYANVPNSQWGRCTDLHETLRHELYHLVDQCRKFDRPENRTGCENCICDELRAFAVSGQCKEGALWFETKYKPTYAAMAWVGRLKRQYGVGDDVICLLRSAAESCKASCLSLNAAKNDTEMVQIVNEVYKKCQKPWFGQDPMPNK